MQDPPTTVAPLSALAYAAMAARCVSDLNDGHFTHGGPLELRWSCTRWPGLPAENRASVLNATLSAADGGRPIVTLL